MKSKEIIKNALILAPPDRVWAALTNTNELGIWSTQVMQLELFLSGDVDLRPVKD